MADDQDIVGVPRTARVVDLETTGLPEDEDARICEVGFIDVSLLDPAFPVLKQSRFTSLAAPGVPMRPEVSAVHHFIDEDFVYAPAIEVSLAKLSEGLTDADVLVAHQAKFEQHFLPGRRQKWIDTYKCALRAWPEAPGWSNQTLRYWLEGRGLISVDRLAAQPPHRALPDAFVTAHIFGALMRMGRPLQRLIDLSAMRALLPVVGFGEHYGKKFSEVPRSYLEWMVRAMTKPEDEDKFYTAQYWLRKTDA
jgi:exodeoxyribonuclease X